LTGYAALAALVGNRVYALRLPQQPVLPAVRYRRISRRPVHVKVGVNEPLVSLRVQFDVVANSYGSLEDVATVLRTALYAYKETAPKVIQVMIENEQDFEETERGAGGEAQMRRVIDAMIWCHEEVS
jgi:hypothetical protein